MDFLGGIVNEVTDTIISQVFFVACVRFVTQIEWDRKSVYVVGKLHVGYTTLPLDASVKKLFIDIQYKEFCRETFMGFTLVQTNDKFAPYLLGAMTTSLWQRRIWIYVN